MCDTSLVAQGSMGLQGAGALVSAYGAFSKAKASNAADEYQAAVSSNNAQSARWQAEDALTRGATAANAHQLKIAKMKGAQRASLAARGIDLGEGNALDILTETDVMGGVDVNTIQDNAAKEAWVYRNQAANHESNAGILRTRASNNSPWGAAAGSLLTGAGQVASSWYALDSKGAFTKKGGGGGDTSGDNWY